MDKIAKTSTAERLKLFQDASNAIGIPVAMVEKDFWVCWLLSKIFADVELSEILRFKGGTSLSKAYNLIERFSEDLDIILDKSRVLGDEGLFKPSYKKQREFADEISEHTAIYINTTLKDKIAAVLGDVAQVRADGQNLLVTYPRASADEYLRPDILLEIGIMSAWIPNEPREILPYIADIYPQLEIASAVVPTIKATRTFWDKATILHRESHRPDGTRTPARYSRHYYDLYRMANSNVKSEALADYKLLADVVDRKDKLYHCAWAKYGDCAVGRMRLLPNDNNKDLLKKDYAAMRGMIFGDIPEWEEILDGLKKLEDEINKGS